MYVVYIHYKQLTHAVEVYKQHLTPTVYVLHPKYTHVHIVLLAILVYKLGKHHNIIPLATTADIYP